MILERQNFMNIRQINSELRSLVGDRPLEEGELKTIQELPQIFELYQAGANEIGTKLENLDSEFQVNYDHNPIHHIEERIKNIQSLIEKLKLKKLDFTIPVIKENIFDVAGIRVITNYIDDVYLVEKMLLKQSDVTLIRRRDYIKNPKASGYRSLHLVVSVPVFQSKGPEEVCAEIQIRTIGMDMWASLEHKLRYKTDIAPDLVKKYGKNLQGYATELNGIEERMQSIYQHLSSYEPTTEGSQPDSVITDPKKDNP